MTNPSNPQQPDVLRVTSWLRPDQGQAGPRRWIPLLVVLTVVVYHAAWMLSDRPYFSPALLILGLALALVVLLSLLGRVKGGLVTLRGTIYYFMALTGTVAAGWGISQLYSAQADAQGRSYELAGTVALICGVFVAAAGVFLRPANTGVASYKAPQDFAAESVPLSGEKAMIFRSRSHFGTTANERILDLAKAEVSCADLNYAALYVEGHCAFYLDVFDDGKVETFFTIATQEQRRREYLRVAAYLHEWLPSMNRVFDDIDVGILIRVVLDVQKGALYYYRIDGRRFLIGVALDQDKVEEADKAMFDLTYKIQRMIGYKPEDEPKG